MTPSTRIIVTARVGRSLTRILLSTRELSVVARLKKLMVILKPLERNLEITKS